MRFRFLVPVVLALVPAAASGHGSVSTFEDILHGILNNPQRERCGCHTTRRDGNLSLRDADAWAQLVGFGFGQPPENPAAADQGKMRVDPGRPWNSFLIDKLRGRLKHGENGRMPQGGTPLDECEIREIERWIVAGAPPAGFIATDLRHSGMNGCNLDHDPGCIVDPCDPSQPALAAPPAADGAARLLVTSPPLSGRDARYVAPPVVSAGSAGFVTRIDVHARPGTESVTVTRQGDVAPVMVAMFDPAVDVTQTETLVLPAGTGVAVEAGQEWIVAVNVVADRFTPSGQADAAIDLTTSSATLAPVEPFVETLGTDLLLTPAKTQGVTGGAAGSEGIVALRVWSDRRAIRKAAVANDEVVSLATGAGAADYVVFDEPLPAGNVIYACHHDNTHLLAMPRWGCGEIIRRARGVPVPPPGLPQLVAPDASLPWCEKEADCTACASPPCCNPANLVGGPNAEDGRCSLVGLRLVD